MKLEWAFVRRLTTFSLVISMYMHQLIKSSAQKSDCSNENRQLLAANQLNSENSVRFSRGEKSKYFFNNKVRKDAFILYKIKRWASIILLAKCLIICLLSLPIFQHFYWLDCYLLGRFCFSGRLSLESKWLCLLLLTLSMIWDSRNINRKASLNLQFVEFLSKHCDEILFFSEPNKEISNFIEKTSLLYHRFYHHEKLKSPLTVNKLHRECCHSLASGIPSVIRGSNESIMNHGVNNNDNVLVYYMRNVFTDDDLLILRPNRTIECWRSIVRFSTGLLMSCALSGTIILTLTTISAAPLILTKPGFELNYSSCVSWISKSPDRLAAYAHIYKKPSRQSYLQLGSAERLYIYPLEDFVDFNWFHSLRIAADIAENLMIWLFLFAAFTLYSLLAMQAIADMRNYALALVRRLKQLRYLLTIASNVSQRRQEQQPPGAQPRDARVASVAGETLEVGQVQAICADYFASLAKYNCMLSFYTPFCAITWLSFSAVNCCWIFGVSTYSESTATSEWIIGEILATFYLICSIGFQATLRHKARTIYSLMASSMALDRNLTVTKRRWMALLRSYAPIPLHCFVMFKSFEISWLLLLKLISWVFSALFVFASLMSRNPN